VPVDIAKYCAGLNAGDGGPLFESGYGAGDLAKGNGNGLGAALLIGLAAPDRDFHSIRCFLDVPDVERD
jgi:hypothetical protein